MPAKLTLRLDEALIERAKATAKRSGKSVSQLAYKGAIPAGHCAVWFRENIRRVTPAANPPYEMNVPVQSCARQTGGLLLTLIIGDAPQLLSDTMVPSRL